jgi:FkbM family methyltransferase
MSSAIAPVIAPASDVSYTIVLPTVYGQVMVNRYDTNQTNALVKTSSAIDMQEIAVMAQLAAGLPQGSTIVDMGANFGLYTLAMARTSAANGCTVHAFEAQRVIAYMVCGTMALNAIENAVIHHLAVGAQPGSIDLPKFDYRQVSSFGSVEFGAQQKEFIGQPRVASTEQVALVSLDSMALHNVKLMKVDVEGMEDQALEGAKATIERDRPLCLVEWIKSDKTGLADFFKVRGYTVYDWGMNLLCLPSPSAFPFQHTLSAL